MGNKQLFLLQRFEKKNGETKNTRETKQKSLTSQSASTANVALRIEFFNLTVQLTVDS